MFPISKVVLPVDFSERARQAAAFAVPVAEHFHSEVIVLHALATQHEFGSVELGGAIVTSELNSDRREQAEKRLGEFLVPELGNLNVRRLLVEGDPAREIVECARREQASLIVMPTHGYGVFRRMLLGSVTAKVLHDADCPVWTAAHVEKPEPRETVPRRILCAIDLGPASARALEWSARMATEFGAQLTLVHAIVELDPRNVGYHFSPEWRKHVVDAAEAEIAALQKRTATQAGVVIALGPVAGMVCTEARKAEADLLVIGRGSETGILGRLTADAYVIIRQSPCPVVSV